MTADRSVPHRRLVGIALALVIAAGLALRWAVAPEARAYFPVDAVYYEDVGRNIAAGRGVVIDYAWMYARGVPSALPMPAHEYWMPGMSLFLGGWFKAVGATSMAVRAACLFLSLLFMLVVWWVARMVTDNDGAPVLAVGLCAIDPVLLNFARTPDACVLQGILVAAGLGCLYQALHRDARWLAPAGLLAGGAHLMRNDGALLIAVLAACLIAARRSGAYRFRAVHLAYFLAPYALVVVPWLVRNTMVFGSPSPGLAPFAFLPQYRDIFRADLSGVTLGAFVRQHHGWGGVLRYDGLVLGRLGEWVALTGANTLALPAMLFLWVKRPAASRPFLYFLAALGGAYAFVLPEVGLNGAFARSFFGLLPLLFAAAAGGVWFIGESLAKSHGRLSRAGWIAVIGALLVAHTAMRSGETLSRHEVVIEGDPYVSNEGPLRAFFAHTDPTQPILTDQPWLIHAFTGRPSLMLPTDGMKAVLGVSRRLNARYVVLPGSRRGSYPGFEEALKSRHLNLVWSMPIVDVPDNLEIFDLQLWEARDLYEKGLAAAQSGDWDLAIERYEAALRLGGHHPPAKKAIATHLAEARR